MSIIENGRAIVNRKLYFVDKNKCGENLFFMDSAAEFIPQASKVN
jgi:hypothetical protein